MAEARTTLLGQTNILPPLGARVCLVHLHEHEYLGPYCLLAKPHIFVLVRHKNLNVMKLLKIRSLIGISVNYSIIIVRCQYELGEFSP